MLLIEPPLSIDAWAKSNLRDPIFQHVFAAYCDKYVTAVLSLPKPQLLKIWRELVRGLQDCDVSPELLHVIVERELKDNDFEASGKVAKLIVLAASVTIIAQQGVAVPDRTRCLLNQFGELIPSVLFLAIHDHFGMLQPS